MISTAFLTHAADVLSAAMSGTQIVRITSAYAVDYGVDLPHAEYPFQAPNKRTALFENLRQFRPAQQYRVIREMCDRVAGEQANKAVTDLKVRLLAQYASLAEDGAPSDIDRGLIVETRHWLDAFPEVKRLYDQALQKHDHGVFTRNALDDLRLSLEKLLRLIFDNAKSLENQLPALGAFVKKNGGSPELANMFAKLVDYYTKYHNTYVKHDDAVITEEVEFVFEITSSFMKHLVRLRDR